LLLALGSHSTHSRDSQTLCRYQRESLALLARNTPTPLISDVIPEILKHYAATKLSIQNDLVLIFQNFLTAFALSLSLKKHPLIPEILKHHIATKSTL